MDILSLAPQRVEELIIASMVSNGDIINANAYQIPLNVSQQGPQRFGQAGERLRIRPAQFTISTDFLVPDMPIRNLLQQWLAFSQAPNNINTPFYDSLTIATSQFVVAYGQVGIIAAADVLSSSASILAKYKRVLTPITSTILDVGFAAPIAGQPLSITLQPSVLNAVDVTVDAPCDVMFKGWIMYRVTTPQAF